MYGYQANSFGLPWWFWMVVPASVWLTVSSAARLWRHRVLGRAMAVLAAANMAVWWWWWWQDMFAFGEAKLQYRYGFSTVFVLAFAITASIAGRRGARRAGEAQPADELEPARH